MKEVAKRNQRQDTHQEQKINHEDFHYIDENYVDEMKRKYSGLVRDFYLGDAL